MKFKYLPKNKISQLPKTAGVYIFKNKDEILYIGKAANLRERVKNHFLQPTYRDNLFINQVAKVGYIKTNSEIEALILEANLIKKYQPKYNVVWRDDKNYFYIGITKEPFPRIFITHQIKIKDQKSKIKNIFIGPFVEGSALKNTLKVLRKIFPFRSCFKIPNRPCLWYHLNRCPAPCLLKSEIIKEISLNSLKIKKTSQKNAKNLIKILKTGKKPVLKELKKEMKVAAKNQDFETAAKIRNQIESLEKVMEHTKIFETNKNLLIQPWQINKYIEWKKIEIILMKILKIKRKISRIEAYDVSNIQGKQATGSMVTFINGLPDKNLYRKFKIKIAGKANDVAMIREILSRRFKHPEWGFPDLILIDGGIAQLNVALKCKMQNVKCKMIKVISLAKTENKLYVENWEKPVRLKNLPRELFNLILQLRDEAHRFARKYHLKLREIDAFG